MTINKKEFDVLKDEVTELKDFFKDSVDRIEKNFSKSNNVQDIASKAGKETRAYISQVSEQAKDAKEQYEQSVKDHPLKSTTFAFLAGCLIAGLIKK